MTKVVNQEVAVTSYIFTNKQDFSSIPSAIELGDQRYSFVDLGLRYLIRQGQHLVRLFDMTDGTCTYRLKNEDDQWTLVSIKTMA